MSEDVGAVAQDTPVEETEAPAEAQQQEEAPSQHNPEWDSIFGDLDKLDGIITPDKQRIKEALTPHLSKLDKRYQEVTEKYRPWEEVIGLGADPDYAKKALGVARYMESDPKGFHKTLTEHLRAQGLTPAEAEKVADKIEEDADSEESDEFTELKKRQELIETQFQERVRKEEEARFATEIDRELNLLKSAHNRGPLKDVPFDEQEIIRRVYGQLNVEGGGKPDFKQAYKDYADFVASIRSIPRPADKVPRLTPRSGGNSLPLNTEGGLDHEALRKMSRDQRAKAIDEYYRLREESA